MAREINMATKKNRSVAQRFGDAFVAASREGSTSIPRLLSENKTVKERADKEKNEDEILKRLTGQDLSGLSPELKKLFVQEHAKRSGETGYNDVYKGLTAQAKNFDLDLEPDMAIDLTKRASDLIQRGVPSSMANSMVLSQFLKGDIGEDEEEFNPQERQQPKQQKLSAPEKQQIQQRPDDFSGRLENVKEVGKEALTSVPAGLAQGTTGFRDWLASLPAGVARKLLGEKAGQVVGALAKAGPMGYTPALEDTKTVVDRVQGEAPKTVAGRVTRNTGELVGNALIGGGVSPWLLPAGAAGQLAEEAGFGTMGKLVTEFAVLGAPSVANYLAKKSSQKIFQSALANAAKSGEEVGPEGLARALEQEASVRGFSAADLEKNTPQARKEMDRILKQFSKEKPSILNERINRVYSEENRAADTLRRQQILEEQSRYANKTSRVREEIVGERERLADAAKKVENETEATLAKKAQIRGAAQEQIPMAQQELDEATQLLNKTKDELALAKKTGASREVLDNLKQKIERFQAGQDIARDTLRKHHHELKSGKPYQSPSELKNNALNKAETIAEDLKNKSVGEVVKENEMNKLAKEYKNRKTIPGQETLPEDTFVRIRDAAIEAYKEKLDEVKSLLRYATGKEVEALEKQKEAFTKLIQVNKEQRLVQRRRQGLQDIGKTLAREQKLKGKDLSSPEIEKIMKETFKFTEENIDGALKKAVDTINETTKKAFKGTGKEPSKFSTILPSFGGRLKKAAQALGSSFKTGNLHTGIPTALSELTSLPLGWAKFLTGAFVAGKGLYSGKAWINGIENFYHSQRLKSLSPQEKVLYLRQLKKDGYSAQRIKKIKGA